MLVGQKFRVLLLVCCSLIYYTKAKYEGCQCSQKPSYKQEHRTVYNLRPQDIGFVGGIGDSFTSGYASRSNNPLNYMVDYLGTSFSTGLEQERSIVKLVQQCNPRVRGGSSGDDGPLTNGQRGLNVGVTGAVSSEVGDQASNFVNQVRQMPGWQNQWKLVTLYVGANDIFAECNGITGYQYGMNIRRALDMLRTLPKTYVVLVGLPDLTQYYTLPQQNVLCGLFIGLTSSMCSFTPAQQKDLIHQFNSQLQQISNEYRYMRKDFTVEYTPAVTNAYDQLSRDKVAFDCFHGTPALYEQISTNIWNSLFQPRQSRTLGNYNGNVQPTCPSSYSPFLRTSNNS